MTEPLAAGPLDSSLRVGRTISSSPLAADPVSSSSLVGRSLTALDDITPGQILTLLHRALWIDAHRDEVAHLADARVMATLFYEPSTRTRLSFETAMMRLGGRVVAFEGSQGSPSASGQTVETIHDLIAEVSRLDDLIVIRHPKEGSARVAAFASQVPVINAGDGSHRHPTQALADIAELYRRRHTLTGLRVGVVGDLVRSRSAHSFVSTLSRMGANRFVLIGPARRRLPAWVRGTIDASDSTYCEGLNLPRALDEGLDVVYMTHLDPADYPTAAQFERVSARYALTPARMAIAPTDMVVLDPLPRLSEIDTAVDDDPRAAYFDEVHAGLLVRMALIAAVLGLDLPEQADTFTPWQEED